MHWRSLHRFCWLPAKTIENQSTPFLDITSGKRPNASVNGTVTYRERLALTPDAKLVVELRDVSYADVAAPLIARQTISGPCQVPIKFKVEYNHEGGPAATVACFASPRSTPAGLEVAIAYYNEAEAVAGK